MTKKRGRKNKKLIGGFTIIEIVIVLAVASLILLIVFLIIPTVQRTQRNYDRKHYVDYIAAQIDSFKSNNYGRAPYDGGLLTGSIDDRCVFIQTYLANVSTVCQNITGGINDCIKLKAQLYDVCFHDRGSSHAYLGPNDSGPYDEISIELGHYCNLDANDPNNIIDSSGAIDNDLHRYVIWTRIENNQIYCVDSGQ